MTPDRRTGQRRGSPEGLAPLLAAKEIVVCCGSGGVGKTSISAAAALGAAANHGGRVLVLTIDPARRLANALGLERLGNVERRVPDASLVEAGLELRGELWAAMLDTKRSWDDLVRRHAPDEETAQRILANPLYHNLTSRFVQSHDYIAMERLFELHSSGRYDLIVVDTPPTRNALDFLDAPARMAEFFGGRLLRWLTAPYRVGGGRAARVIDFASRPFYQMADRILGSQFLQDIAEFFLNFQSMYDGFVQRAHAVEQLLHEKRTTFVVVTTLEDAPLREGEFFCEQLRRRGFHLGALVTNKTLPAYFRGLDGRRVAKQLAETPEPVAKALAETTPPVASLGDRSATARVLRTVGESFTNFSVVATREAELRDELRQVPDVLVDVPELPADVHDLEGLLQMGRSLLPRP